MTRMRTTNEGPKVLVIDDEPRLCLFISDNLLMMGCKVQVAHTGEAGIELMKNQQFDVVLCDIMMPGAGGIWTLETIKEIWASTEVIMMTGYATQESAEVCKALGAFDFMTKPFEIDDVRAAIEKAYQQRMSIINEAPAPVVEAPVLVHAAAAESMAEGTVEDVLARLSLATV